MLVNAVENQVIPRYHCHTARVPLKVCRYSLYNLGFKPGFSSKEKSCY